MIFFSLSVEDKLLTIKSAENVSGHSLLILWNTSYTDDAEIIFCGLPFYNKWNKFKFKNLAEISLRNYWLWV